MFSAKWRPFSLGFNVSKGLILGKRFCRMFPGVKMAVEAWMTSHDLDGIIGATCSVVCQPVALIAAAWNIPMVSNLCTSGYLSDRTIYPTFTRSVGTQIQNSFTLDALMDAFGYIVVVIDIGVALVTIIIIIIIIINISVIIIILTILIALR